MVNNWEVNSVMKPLNRLRSLREARGWSRAELARRAGMHPADVGRLEAGKAYLWPAWRRKLAAALGLSESDAKELFEGDDRDEPRDHGSV